MDYFANAYPSKSLEMEIGVGASDVPTNGYKQSTYTYDKDAHHSRIMDSFMVSTAIYL